MIITVLFIASILLMLSLGIIVFVLRYQKRLIAHQHHMQELQAEKKRQVLEVALEAQEAERRRLARDLHDDVGAMLALVKMHVGQLARNSSSDPETDMMVQKIKQELEEVIGSVRRISHDLMPAILEKFGLVQAVTSLKRSIPASAGITFHFIYNEEFQLEPKLALTIFRVIQELITNTLKHAEASTIEVALSYTSAELRLSYKDDGKGYNEYTSIKHDRVEGIGITNLKSRIEIIKGEITISSAEGAGVEVLINVPISLN